MDMREYDLNRFHGAISMSNSLMFKAIACILIVLHHYAQLNIDGTIINRILYTYAGFIPVAIFFFFSGYGLMEAEKKNHSTFVSFLSKRLLRVYKPFIIINIIAMVIYKFAGVADYFHSDFLLYLIGFKFVDNVTWFVNVVFLFYLFFFVAMRLKNPLIQVASICLLQYIFLLINEYYLHWWISGIWAFPIGVLYSLYRESFAKYFSRHLIYLFLLCLLLLVYSSIGVILVSEVRYTFVLLCIIVFSCFLSVNLPTCNYLGNISYELYLVHMKVYALLVITLGITLTWYWFLSISLIIAALMHWILKMIQVDNILSCTNKQEKLEKYNNK